MRRRPRWRVVAAMCIDLSLATTYSHGMRWIVATLLGVGCTDDVVVFTDRDTAAELDIPTSEVDTFEADTFEADTLAPEVDTFDLDLADGDISDAPIDNDLGPDIDTFGPGDALAD